MRNKSSMTRKNPTSPIRAGFDYQDMWGLHLCLDWLKQPYLYSWMKFETIPEEIEGRDFYLDDILLQDQNSRYHLYQIKHRQNPIDEKWEWDDFLKQEKDSKGRPKNSLLEKWFLSYFKEGLEGKVEYVAFLTNGYAADNIKKYITEDNKIEIVKVRDELPDFYTQIKAQMPDESKISHFFANFHFNFGQLDKDDLETYVRESFYTSLKATRAGVTNLLREIHKECGQQYTQKLYLDQIRNWCEFDNPRPLNESFSIPKDFELFDVSLHEKILSDLQNSEGGIKVIYGKPGSGKSTYLSSLYKLLTDKGIVAVRHHYHISPNDPSPLERLNSERAIEALKAQVKEHNEELGELAVQNSKNIPLREYLSQLSKYYHSKNKAFVFIVDGLDHVLRHGDEKELREFLYSACFPQPGLWIIFGMQEFAEAYLPQIVFDKCPENEWVEIKGLSKNALSMIVEKNTVGLQLPDHTEFLSEAIERLFEVTQGNPLHLRYTLKQLKNNLGNKPLTVYELDDLLPYDNDIAQYYNSLWRRLPALGQTLSLIIATFEFRLKEEQLLNLAASIENNPSHITEGYKSVSHLLNESRKGLSIFHNSFEAFLMKQPECKQQERSIKETVMKWLERSDYEELKWSELRKIAYALGNPKPILEIGKRWLINAICQLREPDQIISQLELGATAAFKNGMYGAVLELSSLNTYYQNATDFTEEANVKIWEEAFRLHDRDILDIDLEALSTKQISIVVQKAEEKGQYSLLADEAIDILNDLHQDKNFIIPQKGAGNMPTLSDSLIGVIAIDCKHDVSRAYDYIKLFADEGWSEDLFARYAETLLKTRQYAKVEELLKLTLTIEERRAILTKCAEHDLISKKKNFLELIAQEDHSALSYFCLLYLLLSNKQITFFPMLPKYDLFPISVPEYETGQRENRAKLFSDNFVLGLIYGLGGKEADLQHWIDDAEKRWVLEIMSEIFKSSLAICERINEGQSILLTVIFDYIKNVKPLMWPEDRDLYELHRAFSSSIALILRTIYILQGQSGSFELSTEEIEKITSTKYFYRDNFLEFNLNLSIPLMSDDAYRSYINEEKDRWEKQIVSFPERAGHYADLAKLARIHNDDINRRVLLELATNNILGYRDHKDTYLFDVLASTKFSHLAGSHKSEEWITRVAPLIENVSEYTDGDETGHLPKYLAEMLVDINPKLLFKYYYNKAQTEELFLAEDIFRYVIRALKLTDDSDIALATTAIENDSLAELKSRADDSSGAKEALSIIEDYFGKTEYIDEHQRTPVTPEKEEFKDFSSIKPEQLEAHLLELKNRWEEEKFLTSWATHWLAQKDVNRANIYDALSALFLKQGIHHSEGDLLDILYPLAYEFDNDNAFEYLCWAQANDNGWNQYWTYKGKAEARWAYVKKYYAHRYMEFLEKSIIYSGKKYGKGGTYFMPTPRVIEFLALFDKLKAIEDITEASVAFAESLMANMKLPQCNWIDICDVDTTDILIQRLIWPSPLIREKAATAIGNLLKKSPEKEIILERLLSWIKSQKLETTVAIGILPIFKAMEIRDEALDYINIDEIVQSLPMTSIVIEKLIENLSNLIEQPITLNKNRIAINPASSGHPTPFFEKHITGFLAPGYLDRARKIEKVTKKDFVKQWSYTSQEIMQEVGLKEQVGDAMYFIGGNRDPIMYGMSTLISEVYRSAFLRVLQDFYDNGVIPEEIYLDYSYLTLPVELSYWKIKPGRAPEWWPKMIPEPHSATKEQGLYKVGFQKDISDLITSENKFMILALDGAAKPADGWQKGILSTSVTVIAFGYKVIGTDIPEAKEVAEKIICSPVVSMNSSGATRPFNFLESYKSHLPSASSPIKINDLIIYPLVARNHDLIIDLWRYFRDYHFPLTLYSKLSAGLNIELGEDSWSIKRNGQVVATNREWIEGLKDKYDKDYEIPHGNYLTADSSFVMAYLDKHDLRLGYIVKTKHIHKKNSYDEAYPIVNYELLNVGRIIM